MVLTLEIDVSVPRLLAGIVDIIFTRVFQKRFCCIIKPLNRLEKLDLLNIPDGLHSFFIRASKFKFRLTVLNFFENPRLDCY